MAKSIQVEVVARGNEDAEKLIRRFIKKVKKEEIIDEVRERRYYKKPSVRRRERKAKRLYIIRNLQK